MRLAILSDIHANLSALQAVLQDAAQHSPDGYVIAGDLVGGPRPVETIRLVRELRAWVVRGNADGNVLRYGRGNAPEDWLNSHHWACRRWTYNNLDRESLDFLDSLAEQTTVLTDGQASIRVVHGSPQRHKGRLCPDSDPTSVELALAQIEEPVLVCGHTHRQWTHENNGRLALNPGAVSGPLDGTIGAQYAMLTWKAGRWTAEGHTVSYDFSDVRTAFRDSGLLDDGGVQARAMLHSLDTGQNTVDDFLSYAIRLAREAGIVKCKVVPDSVWESAEETFSWGSEESVL